MGCGERDLSTPGMQMVLTILICYSTVPALKLGVKLTRMPHLQARRPACHVTTGFQSPLLKGI